jgi:Rad3-related DNA helicase
MVSTDETEKRFAPFFPYDEYRPHQKDIYLQSANSLFNCDNGVGTVVIDAPTGIGKSGINTALGRLSDDAFYTTPQKKLRRQLEEDDILREHYNVLRARSDYTCQQGTLMSNKDVTHTCKSCPVIHDDDDSCKKHGRSCAYWWNKEEAMDSHVAAVTFSYLIADGRLPVYDEQNVQISFSDRDLLIIDEAHALEEQVASLHAGFSISPATAPYTHKTFETSLKKQIDSLDDGVEKTIEIAKLRQPTADLIQDTIKEIEQLKVDINNTPDSKQERLEKLNEDHDKLKSLLNRIKYFRKSLNEGKKWVASAKKRVYDDAPRLVVTIKPVFVADFLNRFLWSRSDKVVLSTATMPYRDEPASWLERLGLDPDRTNVIQKPMPFPAEQRPVYTNSQVAKFSNGGDRENWAEIVDAIREIANKHSGEKGLIHTVSYSRAEKLHHSFKNNSVIHRRDGRQDREYIEKWQNSDDDMLLTPAMTEGVDLPHDKCRWQVLVKIPYPSKSDPRTKYLIDEENDWQWYYEVTARQVVQSAGRAVRDSSDEAEYYILDKCWDDVKRGAAIPEWFSEAIVSSSVESGGIESGGVEYKTQKCDVCSEEKYHKHVHKHHVSYMRNRFIRACRDCHQRIHHEEGFRDDLKPAMTRAEAEEKLNRKLR